MIDSWRKALDDDRLVGEVFLDFNKAFYMISNSILLKKLECYGVRHGGLKWFHDYLSGRKQRVCVGGIQSDWIHVTRGVPQGSILGPLFLLSLLMNCPIRFRSVKLSSMKTIPL